MARHTFVVTPAGYKELLPKPLSRKTDCTAQLSVAVGVVYDTVVLHWPGAAVAEMFAGQVIVGSTLSATVTVNEQVLVRPAPSVAFHTTVWTLSGKPSQKPSH